MIYAALNFDRTDAACEDGHYFWKATLDRRHVFGTRTLRAAAFGEADLLTFEELVIGRSLNALGVKEHVFPTANANEPKNPCPSIS